MCLLCGNDEPRVPDVLLVIIETGDSGQYTHPLITHAKVIFDEYNSDIGLDRDLNLAQTTQTLGTLNIT